MRGEHRLHGPVVAGAFKLQERPIDDVEPRSRTSLTERSGQECLPADNDEDFDVE